MTVCQRCNSRLTFLGQVYCPMYEKEETFHRMIYLYCCLKKMCQNSSEGVRVFRCQLSRSNQYFSEMAPDYSLLELSDPTLSTKHKEALQVIFENEEKFPEALRVQDESKKLSQCFLIDIEDEQSKLTKKIYKKLHLLEQGEEDLDAYDSDDSVVLSKDDRELLEKYQEDEKEELTETLDAAEKQHAKELLKKYIETEGANDPDIDRTKELLENFDNDEDGGDDEEEIDELVDGFDKEKAKKASKEFDLFLQATKANPSQVIRYCQKGMLPLWSAKKFRLRSSEIPTCNNCNGKMTYEMQLMPPLYNYINELVNLNWNSVVIYT